MDIRESLAKDPSKENIRRIAEFVGNDKTRFQVLIDMFVHDEWRTNQRILWAITHCVEKKAHLIYPHLRMLLDVLKEPKIHNAYKRNTTKILSEIDIPEEFQGEALDLCFNYLLDVQEAIAVRVFSMQVAYNISQNEPDLLRELATVIEEFLPYGSAGFKARGKKILKQINKKLSS